LTAIEIFKSPADSVSPDKARQLTRFVSRHETNKAAFVRHFDELSLKCPLDNLEQIPPKFSAGDLHESSVTPDMYTMHAVDVRYVAGS
jgi:hypothetical protein